MHKPLIRLIRSLVISFLALGLFVDQGVRAVSQQGPPRTNDRISGTVQSVDKNTKMITIQSRGVRMPRQVRCDAATKLTGRGNQPVTVDALKKGQTIACTGSFNDKQQFLAQVCAIQ